MNKTPLVSISCITYNHAPYIREALEGFVSQQTDFPFEVLIHDDCSTDGTTEIIREYEAKYPEIIKPMYETENQYSLGKPIGTQVWNLPRAQGKYIALCEGDDYWTDPLKLQKQVDFLESHPDFGMCYTDFDVRNEAAGRYTKAVFSSGVRGFKSEYSSAEEFIPSQEYMCPPSWMFRKDIFPKDMIRCNDNSFVMFCHFLCTSKVKYLPFVSATYRIVSESASHSADFEKLYRRMKDILRAQLEIIDRYNLEPTTKQKCEENFYRLHLVDLIIHKKEEDVRAAKTRLSEKTSRDRILFALHDLHLTPLLRLARRLHRDRL